MKTGDQSSIEISNLLNEIENLNWNGYTISWKVFLVN
jgi:hypothetical protein